MKQLDLFPVNLSRDQNKVLQSLRKVIQGATLEQFENVKTAVNYVDSYFRKHTAAIDLKNNDVKSVYEFIQNERVSDPLESVEQVRLRYLMNRIFNEDRAYKEMCNGFAKIHKHGKKFNGKKWT